MSNPLLRLKRIFNKSNRVTTGLVVSNDLNGLRVSTQDGVKSMTQTDSTNYKAGDKVQVQGQIVTGKIASEEGIMVYTV